MRKLIGSLLATIFAVGHIAFAADIVHDAEYYILEAQNGKAWAAEDDALDKKLAELRAEYGTPPNIIHVAAAFYDLPNDTREKNPMMVNVFHLNEAFGRMRARHETWKKKYPDSGRAHGMAYTGLSNARPETKALANPPAEFQDLPFDPNEILEYELPWEFQADPDLGQ